MRWEGPPPKWTRRGARSSALPYRDIAAAVGVTALTGAGRRTRIDRLRGPRRSWGGVGDDRRDAGEGSRSGPGSARAQDTAYDALVDRGGRGVARRGAGGRAGDRAQRELRRCRAAPQQ